MVNPSAAFEGPEESLEIEFDKYCVPATNRQTHPKIVKAKLKFRYCFVFDNFFDDRKKSQITPIDSNTGIEQMNSSIKLPIISDKKSIFPPTIPF